MDKTTFIASNLNQLSFGADMKLHVGAEGPFQLTAGAYNNIEDFLGFDSERWLRHIDATYIAEEINRRFRVRSKKITLQISADPLFYYHPPCNISPARHYPTKGYIKSINTNHIITPPREILQALVTVLTERFKIDGLSAHAIISDVDVVIKILFPENKHEIVVPTKIGDLTFKPGIGARIPLTKLEFIRMTEYWYCPSLLAHFTGLEKKEVLNFQNYKLPATPKNIRLFFHIRLDRIMRQWETTTLLIPKCLEIKNNSPDSIRESADIRERISAYTTLYSYYFGKKIATALGLATTANHYSGHIRHRLEMRAMKFMGVVDAARKAITAEGN